MRKLRTITIAVIAAAGIAGVAVAASTKSHVFNVSLPDGSVARVEYVGDIAPKVTIAPQAVGSDVGWTALGMASFAGFDRMIEQMNRQTEAMIRQAHQMVRQPTGAPYVAAYGNLPGVINSTTVVSYSNGGRTCTRTTSSVSQGAGKPPKVTSSVSGDCGSGAAPSELPST